MSYDAAYTEGYSDGIHDIWDNPYDFDLEPSAYEGYEDGYLDGLEDSNNL